MGFENDGSIVFGLSHDHKDWSTNSATYNFPTIKQKDITVEAKKHSDKTIEIKIEGLFDKSFKFQKLIPPCDQRGLQVAITWKDDKVELYLNGKPEESKTFEEAENEAN